jgi:citrate lyase beta subunit
MSGQMTSFRSLLFVPGNRPDRFDKAAMAGADCVCIDLEDAVPPDEKDSARREVFSYLGNLIEVPCQIGMRINHPATQAGKGDIAALKAREAAAIAASDDELMDGGLNGPGFVMVPKVADPTELSEIGGSGLWPVIESAQGLRKAWDIAESSLVSGLLFGGADYSAEVGCTMGWEALAFARGHMAAAAALRGIQLLDVPFLDVRDDHGLRGECERVKALGFTGKACIHPNQVAIVNEVFSPSAAEMNWAKRVIAAGRDAGGNAVLMDGKLLDAPVYARALRIQGLRR